MNVFYKSKSIYANSFIRQFSFSGENESLIKYYCAVRINPLFRIRELPQNVSYISPPFYTWGIDIIRTCFKMKIFPIVTSHGIYEHIMVKHIPKVEEKYSLFNWKVIWKNIAFKFICSDERCVLFKYMNEILPNRLRLYNIKRKPSPNCDSCNIEENNLHMVYYCKEIKQLLCFLRELLKEVLSRHDLSLMRLLFLDTSMLRLRESNTVVALVTNYICTIWYNRGHTGDKLYILI